MFEAPHIEPHIAHVAVWGALEGGEGLPGGGVPHNDRPVLRDGGEAGGVGAEGHGVDPVRVLLQGGEELDGLQRRRGEKRRERKGGWDINIL